MELHDEGVVDHLHYISLDLCVIYLISSDDEIFFERLHCIYLFIIFFLSHVHFAKGTATNDLEQLEIFDLHRGVVALAQQGGSACLV